MITTAVEDLSLVGMGEMCDRCSARALVSTSFMVGDQVRGLRWCGHHFAAHEDRLRKTAVFLQVTMIGGATDAH